MSKQFSGWPKRGSGIHLNCGASSNHALKHAEATSSPGNNLQNRRSPIDGGRKSNGLQHKMPPQHRRPLSPLPRCPGRARRHHRKKHRKTHIISNCNFKLQHKFAQIAADLPTGNTQSRQAQASASGNQPQPTSQPQNTPTPTKTTEPQTSSHKVAKVTAQALAEKRPEPPTPPAMTTPKVDAPGTGELSHSSSTKPLVEHPKTQTRDEALNKAEEKIREEASPESSPTESSDTLATETAVNSSPEETRAPEYHTAVAEADLPTLRIMRKEAKKKMAALTSELSTLQGHLDCLNKRIGRTMDTRGLFTKHLTLQFPLPV